MLKNVMLGFYYLCTLQFRSFIALVEYGFWYRRMKDCKDYTVDKASESLQKLGKDYFSYSGAKLPYGRLKWYFVSDKKFNKYVDESELVYYGFSPIRSEIEEDFNEFGLVLSQYGIFEKTQVPSNERGVFNVFSNFYPLAGLWKVLYENGMVVMYYRLGRIKKFKTPFDDEKNKKIVVSLMTLINTGYTKDIEEPRFEPTFEQKVNHFLDAKYTQQSIVRSVISGIISNVSKHTKSLQINSMATGSMGHGHAAEYANHLVDTIKHPWSSVKQVGQSNSKNGADRIVGNQEIQTKYHYKASSTVNAAFDKAENGGMYKYSGMQLEVPRDQYEDAIKIMQKKIRDGKVDGVTDPDDARRIIRKGVVTRKQAELIAKGGNVTSLTFDLVDGAIQSLPGVGISFVVVFAQSRWHGYSSQESAKIAVMAGVKTLVVGSVVYASSQQFAKIMTNTLRDIMRNDKLPANIVAGKIAPVIYFGLAITPDLFDAVSGRISSQQLLKNVTVAGSGILGGTAGGAVAGTMFGPVGTVIGAMIGGIGGSSLAKVIMDQWIIDDRVEMFAQLKEEYIEIVMLANLTSEEFEILQQKVFNGNLESLLKSMFQKKHKSREFANETVEKHVIALLKEREKINKDMIIEAREISEGLFVS